MRCTSACRSQHPSQHWCARCKRRIPPLKPPPAHMAPRAPTAYFTFVEEQRAAAKAELEAEGAKAGVAQVAKLVGAKWAALSDEEKQEYKHRAAAKAQQLAGAAAAVGSSSRQPPTAPLVPCPALPAAHDHARAHAQMMRHRRGRRSNKNSRQFQVATTQPRTARRPTPRAGAARSRRRLASPLASSSASSWWTAR